MVMGTGHLSGAHLNPAVTLAFVLTRHFPLRDVPAYIGAQLIGAVGGAATLRILFGNVANLGVRYRPVLHGIRCYLKHC